MRKNTNKFVCYRPAVPLTFGKNSDQLRSVRYIALLLLLLGIPVYGQKTVWVEPGVDQLLAGFIGHYEDTTARLSIRQIAELQKLNRFTVLPSEFLNQGYTASNHWLHIRLSAKTPQTVFLELDNPRINNFQYYQVTDNQLSSPD